MSTTDTRPNLPDWLNLDEVISPDHREGVEQHVRTVAEAIVGCREAFEAANAYRSTIDNSTGELPNDVYALVQDHYTQMGLLWDLLHRFSEVVSPDANLAGLHRNVERLDEALARVPGLGH